MNSFNFLMFGMEGDVRREDGTVTDPKMENRV